MVSHPACRSETKQAETTGLLSSDQRKPGKAHVVAIADVDFLAGGAVAAPAAVVVVAAIAVAHGSAAAVANTYLGKGWQTRTTRAPPKTSWSKGLK